MEIQFYHLLTTPLEVALPRLLEKAYAGDFRVLVKCADAAQAKKLDEALWTYHPDSFLPHGLAGQAHEAAQPVLVSTALDNPNGATILTIIDGTELSQDVPQGIGRVLDMFDGSDEAALTAARQRWKQYKERGLTLSYIKQQPNGSWKKEA